MEGRFGAILRVDLSSRKMTKEALDERLLRNYIGGRGYASKVLYDENPPNVDPLSPENRLIIATGPLTGRAAPAAGRYMVDSLRPIGMPLFSGNKN
jgi:aldehyde:ferredoxin oxidoreductase